MAFQRVGQQATFLFSLLLLFSLLIRYADVSSVPPFLVDGEVNNNNASLNNSAQRPQAEATEMPILTKNLVDGQLSDGHHRWKSEGRSGGHLRKLLWHLTEDQATMDDHFRAKDEEDIRRMLYTDIAGGRDKNSNDTARKNVINRHRITDATTKNGTMTNKKTTIYFVNSTKFKQQQIQQQQQQNVQKKTRQDKLGKKVKMNLFKHISNESNNNDDTSRSSSSRPTPPTVTPAAIVVPPQKFGGKLRQKMMQNVGNTGPPAIAPHSPGTSTQQQTKWHRPQQNKEVKLSKKNGKNKKVLLLRKIFKTGHGISRENVNSSIIINNETLTEPKLHGIITTPLYNNRTTNVATTTITTRQQWDGISNAKTVPCYNNVRQSNSDCLMSAKRQQDNTDCCHTKHGNCCPCFSAAFSETIITAEVIGGGNNGPFISSVGGGCQQTDHSTDQSSLLQNEDYYDHHQQQQPYQVRERKMHHPIVFPILQQKMGSEDVLNKNIVGKI